MNLGHRRYSLFCETNNPCNWHYYSFGSIMPGREYTAQSVGGYRFGFNGKEKDDEISDFGNQQDYGMRIYDTRLGKFLSVDPITNQYPELTPFQFASNTPIWAIDRDGLEAWPVTKQWSTNDVAGFSTFVNQELTRITGYISDYYTNPGSRGRIYYEYNCADLAVALYVRYAAVNGLPVTFHSSLKKNEIVNSQDPKYKFDPNHPQKSVDQFETDARVKTNAASLVIYGDAIPIEVSDVVSGDFNDNKKHTMVVRDQYENEDVTPGSTPFSYGNLDNGYTSDPLEGTIGLTEKAWPINPNKPNMFRFKELANAPAPPAQVPITPSSGGSSVSPVVIPQQRDSTECPFCH